MGRLLLLLGRIPGLIAGITRGAAKVASTPLLFRRLLMLWSVVLITWVTHIMFTSPPNISAGAATAYGVVVGILGTVIALYKWGREKDAEREFFTKSGRSPEGEGE